MHPWLWEMFLYIMLTCDSAKGSYRVLCCHFVFYLYLHSETQSYFIVGCILHLTVRYNKRCANNIQYMVIYTVHGDEAHWIYQNHFAPFSSIFVLNHLLYNQHILFTWCLSMSHSVLHHVTSTVFFSEWLLQPFVSNSGIMNDGEQLQLN